MSAIPLLSAPATILSDLEGANVALPVLWLRRLRHRRALAELDIHQIRETGLDPLLVRRESLKPFWRG